MVSTLEGIDMISESSNCQDNIISKDKTIIEAIKILDGLVIKALFVVDDTRIICASLTDGDIRRAILAGVDLGSTVDSIANHSFTFVYDKYSIDEVDELMLDKGITVIPVIDSDKHIIRILYKRYVRKRSYIDKVHIPVVIMAGGKGTRLYPYTKILPKPLIPIDDIPICERIINLSSEAGCNQFFIIVNYKKNMIKAYFADAKLECDIEFIDEDIPLGTGGGLKLLEGKLDNTFIMTNSDILIMEDVGRIVNHHVKENNDVTMVCSLKNFEIPYGTVEFTEGGEIVSFNEKPKLNFFTNTGYYIAEPCIMDYIGDNESIDMPDVIERMRTDGKRVGVYPISDSLWLDMGQFDSMENMERRLKSNI